MQTTDLSIMGVKDPYEIPLFNQHPYLNKKIVENYQKVLSYSNLKLHEQISHRNVRIFENEYIHQIYTKNDPSLPHMVFLHGYGGTSMTAIRMFQHLFSYFQVHALDSFGIGYSSRGNFNDNFTNEQTRDYYVDALEEWRKAMRIDKMYLTGHSFGGYLAACYAIKYPSRVAHLFLISPAGTSERKSVGNPETGNWKSRMFLCLAQKVYAWNIRPSTAMTNFFFGQKIVKSVLNNRLKLREEEQNDWLAYFSHVNSQAKSSEVGFYRLFDWPLNPKITIENMIRENPNLPFEIDFYFGDSDWMPKTGAEKLREQKWKGIHLSTIPNAGHQIVFDNSPDLCARMINRLKQLSKK